MIGRNPIKYQNSFPLIKWALLSQRQLKYVEDIIVTIYTANFGVERKETIQVISDIGQANTYVQEYNQLDYLIR